jgi:tetratricopeptide (TPR) repeat protein
MESCRKLDAAGRSQAVKSHAALVASGSEKWIFADLRREYLRRSVALLLIFLLLGSPALGFSDPSELSKRIEQLVQAGRWPEVVKELRSLPSRDADLNYFYGLALAQLGNYPEAERALVEGRREQPRDKRFPVELAGIAFKQKQYGKAQHWLRRALRLDSSDSYTNDFAGTVFLLEGNLPAALKYWNRVNKPAIQNVREEPELRIRPELLDRAFAFAPASVLHLPDLLTSESRIEGLGIFPVYKFQLDARADGNFDFTFRGTERDGWGANKWDALLSTFRGAFYETVYPEYFNLHGSATNFTSLLRWDSQKRRAFAEISGPLWQNPKFRYAGLVDLRNENWNVVTAFTGPAMLLGALNLRREGVTGEISSFNRGGWSWSMGMELSHRDYRSVFEGTALTPDLVLNGFQLKQLADIHSTIWSVPERRFQVTAAGSEQAARVWSTPRESFLKLQGSLQAHWWPRSESDDYEIDGKLRAGKTLGQTPFDELFMLGLERDNDLPMRAHIGTRDGRKGSAPLGQNYFLSNWEINKNVYDNGLIGIRVSPFLDTGKITDPNSALGSKKWLFDTGLQVKFRVLVVGLTFTYGKDLRSGANAFYFTAQ